MVTSIERFDSRAVTAKMWLAVLSMAAPIMLAMSSSAAIGQSTTAQDVVETDNRTLEDVLADQAMVAGNSGLRDQSDCAARDAKACTAYGFALLTGTRGQEVDKAEGISYLEQGCELGHMAGCRGLGMVKEGKADPSLPSDFVAARKAYLTGCNGRDAASCWYGGHMFGRGQGGEKNGREAVQLIRKSCSLGYAQACSWIEDQKSKRAAAQP